MRFALALLLFPAFAPQDEKPPVVYHYVVHDAGGKREQVDGFDVFASEIREPGFDRFSRHELARIPYEFLFIQLPAKSRAGTKWTVESIPAADALKHGAVFGSGSEPLWMKIAGTYERGADEQRDGMTLTVVKGTLAITRMKLTPIDDFGAQKKAGRRGELKNSKDVLGGIAVELRLRADGILHEAQYRYSIKAQDTQWFLKNSHPAAERVASGYEHSRRVTLASERELDRKGARDIAKKAVEAARAWLLTQQERDGAFWDLDQQGKGMRHSDWRHLPTSDAIRALRAAGMTAADKPIQAALAIIRDAAAISGAFQAGVGTVPLAYQPVTPDQRRAEFAGDDVRKALSAADAQWLAAAMKKMTDARAMETGLWSSLDLSSESINIVTDGAGEIALSIHEATLLGFEVPPETWKRAIATLKKAAIEVAPVGRIDVTLQPDNLYKDVLAPGEHRVLAWPRMPVAQGSSPLPGGTRATWGALMVLAVARWHLMKAGALDAGAKAILDDLQRGGWAWICANHRSRWIDRSAFVSDPAGGGGLESVSLASVYGIRTIRGHDPVVEMTVRLAAEQREDGGWGIGWSRRMSVVVGTAQAMMALTEFAPPLWRNN